jgi:hypothetical protein
MLRKAVLAAALLGMAGGLTSGIAGARDWNDHGNRDRWQDSRRDDNRRYDDRRYDNRSHDNARQYRGWAPRYMPAPRYYGYAAPRRDWREPYGRGYRYWRNDRYYYAEPGRPDVELRFVLPLR